MTSNSEFTTQQILNEAVKLSGLGMNTLRPDNRYLDDAKVQFQYSVEELSRPDFHILSYEECEVHAYVGAKYYFGCMRAQAKAKKAILVSPFKVAFFGMVYFDNHKLKPLHPATYTDYSYRRNGMPKSYLLKDLFNHQELILYPAQTSGTLKITFTKAIETNGENCKFILPIVAKEFLVIKTAIRLAENYKSTVMPTVFERLHNVESRLATMAVQYNSIPRMAGLRA